MTIEIKQFHTSIASGVKYVYIEYTNGQCFECGWKDGKPQWFELPCLPQPEEPKVVAH